MARKEFTYKGKSVDEIKALTIKEFAEIAPARIRRSIKRGFRPSHEQLLAKLRKSDGQVKTHCRDMVIVPEMIDRTILVYSGKEFKPVTVTAEMVGHYLGEYAFSRKMVSHSAPGVGATKSSSHVSVK